MATKTATKKPPAKLSAPPAAALTPLELHAVKIAGKKADRVRDALDPRDGQPVDVTVRLHGAITVGATTPAGTGTVRLTPPLADLLEAAIALLSAHARRGLEQALTEHFARWPDHKEGPAIDPAPAQKLLEKLARDVTASTDAKRGNVTGSIAVELIDRGGGA